jgi:hypothetical protein
MLVTNDRRSALRLPVAGPILVRVADLDLRGTGVDLGTGGLGAVGRQRLPTQAPARVTLQLEGRAPTSIDASVVRSSRWRGLHRWGLRFDNLLDPAFVDALDLERLRISRWRQAHPYLTRLTPSARPRPLRDPCVSLQEPCFAPPEPDFEDRPTAVFRACPALVQDPPPRREGLLVDLREQPSGFAVLRWRRRSTHRIALSLQLGKPPGVPERIEDDATTVAGRVRGASARG